MNGVEKGLHPHRDKRIPLEFLEGNDIKTWYRVAFKTLKQGTKPSSCAISLLVCFTSKGE
jgi:hypothetical protein